MDDRTAGYLRRPGQTAFVLTMLRIDHGRLADIAAFEQPSMFPRVRPARQRMTNMANGAPSWGAVTNSRHSGLPSVHVTVGQAIRFRGIP